MSTFTCLTCHVAFKDGNFQRLHYKSDWHRYNLKRKIVDLPPVALEDFQRHVLQKQLEQNEKQTPKNSIQCKTCHVSFSNQNVYENHVNSKKHKRLEKELPVVAMEEKSLQTTDTIMEEDIAEESSSDLDESDDEPNPIDQNNCLFCLFHSGSMTKNLKHMAVAHSFFIANIEFCTDIKELLHYLGEKISKGYLCLWCNDKGRAFHSAESARQHMLDKGHCKMVYEGVYLIEYEPFYDYSPSYPDAIDNNVDIDEEIELPEIDTTDFQLVLPSGAVIGHRSLMRYYKQRISSNAIVVKNDRKYTKVFKHYRALGYAPTQETIRRKVNDIDYMKRYQAKFNLKLSVQANKFNRVSRKREI